MEGNNTQTMISEISETRTVAATELDRVVTGRGLCTRVYNKVRCHTYVATVAIFCG